MSSTHTFYRIFLLANDKFLFVKAMKETKSTYNQKLGKKARVLYIKNTTAGRPTNHFSIPFITTMKL